MKKTLVAATLTVIFILALATPAFAMTHTYDAVWDGVADVERQVGHKCNTGAEQKVTIAGEGKMEWGGTASISKGVLTVDEDYDFVTAEGATENLVVTSVIELCAPPKATATYSEHVVREWDWMERDVTEFEITQDEFMDAIYHVYNAPGDNIDSIDTNSLEQAISYLQGKIGNHLDRPGSPWSTAQELVDYAQKYVYAQDNAGNITADSRPWDCKEREKTYCSEEIPWLTLKDNETPQSLLDVISQAWELFAYKGLDYYEEVEWVEMDDWEFVTDEKSASVIKAPEWFDNYRFKDGSRTDMMLAEAWARGDRQATAEILSGNLTAAEMDALARELLGDWFATWEVNELTEQIWAVQVEAYPGMSGNLSQDFEAAYGNTYEGWVDEKADLSDDGWGFTEDTDLHQGWRVLRGEDYVGNYFHIDQMARTSDGELRRFIDISEPFEGNLLHEDFEVIGEVEVEEAFTMDVIEPGAEMEVKWYDLF